MFLIDIRFLKINVPNIKHKQLESCTYNVVIINTNNYCIVFDVYS